MHIRRSAVELVIQAPAKLNLFFELLARRSDGYHEIETLMCPISLFDTLIFRRAEHDQIRFGCRCLLPATDVAQKVPLGPDNLVVRAVEAVRRQAGLSRGAEIQLIKRIPTAAGLGGGSSDAAAALVAANEGWQAGLPHDQLVQMAAQLGSDVPFFLARQSAICRGRGEKIELLANQPPLHFVIVYPPQGLSTANVYAAAEVPTAPRSVQPLLHVLQQGDWRQLGQGLHNRLQPAAERLSPWIRRLEREFENQDCLGHRMSGSGTSYFGVWRTARHARRAAARLRARGLGTVFAVAGCN